MKLNVKKIALSLAIMLSVFSFSLTVKASYTADVLTYWEHVTQSTGTSYVQQYDRNQTYETIVYPNGYTYRETTSDITTVTQILLGIHVVAHYRDYSVY